MGASRAPPVALVVEDEGLIRMSIAEDLRADGWTVHETATGEEAMGLFRANHIDVVFTDIELAGTLSGWEVAEIFRSTHPDLAIIYTSGKVALESRKVSDSVFFGKPYDNIEVLAACDRLVAR